VSYYLAPCLVKLRSEINALFPHRDKSSDGWIGDASHAAGVSDHNPDWSAGGVVRAIDVDVDDNDPSKDLRRMVLEACIGDHRVWYVISNGIIYSRTYGWAARKYTGPSAHFDHVHISIQGANGITPEMAKRIESDTSSWFATQRTRLPSVNLPNVREQFLNAVQGRHVKPLYGVKLIQRALNSKNGERLKVDGIVGKGTLNAWGRWEQKVGGSGRPRVPDPRSLRRLGAGRFAVHL
jgi:hypothetical protein